MAAALVTGVETAQNVDPQFLAAKSEKDIGMLNARVARSAYLPEFQASRAQYQNQSQQSTTLTLSQPVFDAERLTTFFEKNPRAALAEANFLGKTQDLATRLVKAVTELVRARETLRDNGVKIKALAQQAESAKRMYELGQGTITDLRDTEVRVAQARATDLSLKARLDTAVRQFQAITGHVPPSGAFSLGRGEKPLALKPLEECLADASSNNPQILMAKQNLRMSELNQWRVKGSNFPIVNAVFSRTQVGGSNTSYSGLQVSLPLKAGGYMQAWGSGASVEQMREQLRDAEEQSRLTVERTRAQVEAGHAEVAIRLSAIRAAELSVEANEMSFRGGVRTRVDVLNAIQALSQAQQDYVETAMTLAEHLLDLELQIATPIPVALKDIENTIF